MILEHHCFLTKGVVKPFQAEAQVEVWAEIINENLATQENIKQLDLNSEQMRSDLPAKVEQVRSEPGKDIKLSRKETTIRLGKIMAWMTGILLAAMTGYIFRTKANLNF